MSEEFVLTTEDLTKHYGGVRALEGANFQLKKGEHVAIMGDNGAGKSTFVRQIQVLSSVQEVQLFLMGKKLILEGRLKLENLVLKLFSKHWP